MSREVEEFCAICNQTLKMPIVQEDGEAPGFLWVQCPVCHEIKPLETRRRESLGNGLDREFPDTDPPPRPASRPGDAPAPAPTASSARPYVPGENYALGDLIYHRQWNDTGRVVSLKESGGGRRMMVVEFEKMGPRKLVTETEPRK